MPNHIANLVVIGGEPNAVKSFMDKVIVEKTNEFDGTYKTFDFEAILPMPEELNIESSFAVKEYLKTGEIPSYYSTPEDRENFLILCQKAKHNLETYGFKDWYDWRIAKWGTKWNAYDFKFISEDTFMFNTAWSTPDGIWEAIAKQYPDIVLKVKFADEDAGYNAGEIDINSGEVEHYEPIGGSDEAWSLYFETHPEAEEEYVYVKGKGWTYYEDVEEGDETE